MGFFGGGGRAEYIKYIVFALKVDRPPPNLFLETKFWTGNNPVFTLYNSRIFKNSVPYS